MDCAARHHDPHVRVPELGGPDRWGRRALRVRQRAGRGRGHEVHFVHGPAWPGRIDSLDELPSFPFEADLQHHIVDTLEDPRLPESDIVFAQDAPARLGLPAMFMQGYRMWLEAVERYGFRIRRRRSASRAGSSTRRAVGVTDPSRCGTSRWGSTTSCSRSALRRRIARSTSPCFPTPIGRRDGTSACGPRARLRRQRPDGGTSSSRTRRRANPPARRGVARLARPAEARRRGVQRGRVFVQTSNHEGFGFTPVEAMACGSALVTTDNGGSRDLRLENETALVVPPGDVDGLVGGVERLLTDDDLHARLVRAGSSTRAAVRLGRSGAGPRSAAASSTSRTLGSSSTLRPLTRANERRPGESRARQRLRVQHRVERHGVHVPAVLRRQPDRPERRAGSASS